MVSYVNHPLLSFSSKDRRAGSRIITVSCLTWKPNTPKKVANPKEGRSDSMQAMVEEEKDVHVL